MTVDADAAGRAGLADHAAAEATAGSGARQEAGARVRRALDREAGRAARVPGLAVMVVVADPFSGEGYGYDC